MKEQITQLLKRVHRDPSLIAEYEAAVVTFLSEVNQTVAQLCALRMEPLEAWPTPQKPYA